MITVGDIVYQRRVGGILAPMMPEQIIKDNIGLVIKELKEKGAVPQYYVKFGQKRPKWYYKHDLHRIGEKGRQNALNP